MPSSVLLHTPVLIMLFSDLLITILIFISAVAVFSILKDWDFHATTPQQYRLENRNYFISLALLVIFIFELILLPYFAYTLDSLHHIVPGAMCAAGVIQANNYGNPLLILKIVIVLLSAFWLLLHKRDVEAQDYPYIRKKYILFLLITLLALFTFALEIAYFQHISLDRPVSCCSVIFGASGHNTLPFNLDQTKLLILFGLISLLMIYGAWFKEAYLLGFTSLLFAPVTYGAIVYFYGTYIYQTPTHICPFCMLQGEYYYVGYLIWSLLLAILFFGSSNAFLKLLGAKENEKYFRLTLMLLLFLLLLLNFYPLWYRYQNGVYL